MIANTHNHASVRIQRTTGLENVHCEYTHVLLGFSSAETVSSADWRAEMRHLVNFAKVDYA